MTPSMYKKSRDMSIQLQSAFLRERSLSQTKYSQLLRTTNVTGPVAELASVKLNTPSKKELIKFLSVMSLCMTAAQAG